MQRTGMTFLQKWLHSSRRLPLIIRGARQVGKTWLVRELALIEGKELIELNLEFDRHYATFFSSNDPIKVIEKIEDTFNIKVDPQKTILFIDEIQTYPELLAKLRWFAERMAELPVIAAGSLLEFVLADYAISIPVGRIEYIYLEPLSFEEFLLAKSKQNLVRVIQKFSWDDDISDHFHEELTKLFHEYLIIGGMPAAVAAWVENRSLSEVSRIHRNIVTSYQEDFPKYGKRVESENLEATFNRVPRSLGKKFVYSQVDAHISSDKAKKALNMLCKALICHKVRSADATGVPLIADDERFFKVILLDVGLCSASLKLSLQLIENVEDITLINDGGIAEQVVGQLLRTLEGVSFESELYYWLRHEKYSSAEVDYVIQHRTTVIPLEVKSGKTGSLRSLHQFMKKRKGALATRICSGRPLKTHVSVADAEGGKIEYELRSVPFYLMSELYRLLD